MQGDAHHETDQAEAIAFCENGAGIGAEADRTDTHGAIIFLIGDRALKMKRAVQYDYMDLSTLEKRKALLEREFELNSKTAPSIYRGVIPLTREADDKLALDGDGDAVEWVLSMWRFPPEAELTHIASNDGIDDTLAQDLGEAIVRYHGDAPVKDADGVTLITEILDELDRVFGAMENEFQDNALRFVRQGRAMLSDRAGVMRARSRAGFVRRCHGDLHLRNIVLLEGVLTPFDALEFDERLGTCDTLYDFAFLLMDLLHRGFAHPANMVLNTYLNGVSDHMEDAGLDILPLFLGIRAAIRAMVSIQTSEFSSSSEKMLTDARDYLQEALDYLDPPAPVLVAIGGLSGSGKTTIARAIAHRIGAFPGAIHIRSDVVRKKIMKVDPLEPLDSEGYAPPITAQTYESIRQQATQVLAQGHAAILDAVHDNAESRAAARDVAQEAGCEFIGIWLETPTDVRSNRVTGRGPDASDADPWVVKQQERIDPGPLDWQQIDADRPLATVISDIAARLPKR
ncbi:bifunctional aminoglycoside phosphotransferase/ATP-binding protein [uncultured Sulfitobacter sp.]|uniref:bifunctional aminoglycoside phosphotransferase/ATP-binding protein n=1 Tax=uncultured Sulfitobacter sp. TaxID=191468 RepID=UPI002628CD9D|nr:bifunctional aminoglycoside phosphotransferase/ATP-binding protein [uncultured Sulfitobacter sp.]